MRTCVPPFYDVIVVVLKPRDCLIRPTHGAHMLSGQACNAPAPIIFRLSSFATIFYRHGLQDVAMRLSQKNIPVTKGLFFLSSARSLRRGIPAPREDSHPCGHEIQRYWPVSAPNTATRSQGLIADRRPYTPPPPRPNAVFLNSGPEDRGDALSAFASHSVLRRPCAYLARSRKFLDRPIENPSQLIASYFLASSGCRAASLLPIVPGRKVGRCHPSQSAKVLCRKPVPQ